jgi:galactokinase
LDRKPARAAAAAFGERIAMSTARVLAFAPGRANLIGEHTDYNDGLSLPFAIEQGVRTTAQADARDALLISATGHGEQLFGLGNELEPFGDWRDFVRGAIGELAAAGLALRGASVEIDGSVPEGGGLSSSAALEVSLCLALMALAGEPAAVEGIELARLCSRIENRWVGAQTGLLDQLASLFGRKDHALRIDFRTLETRAVPLELGDWSLIALDSGEQHSLAESAYNQRREECSRAREMLGIESLREATPADAGRLPDPLGRRVRHVIEENARVDQTVAALEHGELGEVGSLLDASHASLRDLYESSTAAVERTVEQLHQRGAAGARMMGGGFGGAVIALFPPGSAPLQEAIALTPSDGARLLSSD